MLWQPRADHEQKHELGDVTITQSLFGNLLNGIKRL